MTETLQKVLAQVELLPPEEQDAIAKAIEEELEEREWDALVSSPASQRFLARLAAKALAEDKAGLTQEAADRW